ncbi:hypothetical protein P3H15_33140 [Rhodococcus sp. T2V]|uniref:hypothetical protein n=1 Tax=Rhodococcus sp. T2V TaxID=3034164 RepID=UPI0023E1809F|nr:hypothetical protein [Rhodococcus sp. T2V]MDF3309866.1 hypothetical protein [Rhodococcus sp. T2V]
MRLCNDGSASRWGFAIYLGSTGKYQASVLPNGALRAVRELDTGCELELADPPPGNTLDELGYQPTEMGR